MKQLFTLCLALMSVTAMAQWPSLPYNPDENGDGLIGVVDLAALLAQYNTEFASAVVSEDGESAIVYMGDMSYPVCATSCKSLPGVWRISDFEDIGLVWNEMQVNNRKTWLDYRFEGINAIGTTDGYFPFVSGNNYELSIDVKYTTAPGSLHRCYCASKQMPRVEYDYCWSYASSSYESGMEEALSQLKSCVDLKLAEGWQLLGATQHGPNYSRYTQALWRWVE